MADLTFNLTIIGTVGGRAFRLDKTSTVADVDAIMLAQAGAGTGSDIFTPQSYGGVSFFAFVGGNTAGLNKLELELGGGDIIDVFTPIGVPFVAYNGGGFNGMTNYSTTATEVPDEDPSRYSGGKLGGLINFRAMAALKAIS